VSSFTFVTLTQLWAMLDSCAQGHTRTVTEHHCCVRWRGRVFYRVPLGAHGRRREAGTAEIYASVVRKIVRQLEIDLACASRFFPALEP
jgi:hypothetical protein